MDIYIFIAIWLIGIYPTYLISKKNIKNFTEIDNIIAGVFWVVTLSVLFFGKIVDFFKKNEKK